MNPPILTHKMLFNLFAIFVSVGAIAAVLPISHQTETNYVNTQGNNIPFDKEMLSVFLPR